MIKTRLEFTPNEDKLFNIKATDDGITLKEKNITSTEVKSFMNKKFTQDEQNFIKKVSKTFGIKAIKISKK